jgi:hypothetical protein
METQTAKAMMLQFGITRRENGVLQYKNIRT